MTQWNKACRVLRSHDSSNPCDLQWISLGNPFSPYQGQCLRRSFNPPTSPGGTNCDRLLRHVNHSDLSVLIQMRKLCHVHLPPNSTRSRAENSTIDFL